MWKLNLYGQILKVLIRFFPWISPSMKIINDFSKIKVLAKSIYGLHEGVFP